MPIRVQSLDGTWDVLGVDRYPGAEPEGISPSWNAWGADGLNFTLRTDPEQEHPALAAYTPIDLVDGEEILWDGFTVDAPGNSTDDPQITVVARGWQYHGDDDLFPLLLVAADINEWRDVRSHPRTQLQTWRTTAQVETSGRAIVLTRPQAQPIRGASVAERDPSGVFIDLGPSQRAVCVAIDWEVNVPATPVDMDWIAYAHAQAAPDTTPLGGTRFAKNDASFGSPSGPGRAGTAVLDFSPSRFIVIYGKSGGTADVTPAEDIWLRVTGLRVFAEAAFRSGSGNSELRASDVIKRALVRGAPLLDQSTADITQTSLFLPSHTWHHEARSFREAAEGVNAYHGWRLQLRPRRRVLFAPQPTRAILKARLGQGCRFQDASSAGGLELYNRVLVQGKTGSGADVEVERTTAHLSSARLTSAGVPQPSNPSLDSNLAGWVNNVGTLVRDTGVFNSSPASARMGGDAAANADVDLPTISGLTPGGIYALVIRLRRAAASGSALLAVEEPTSGVKLGGLWLDISLAAAANSTLVDQPYAVIVTPLNTWTTLTVPFVAPASGQARFSLVASGGPVSSTYYYLDDYTAVRSVSTLLDRRGRVRTKVLQVQSPSDAITLAALGDAWIAMNSTTPLKGTLAVDSDDAIVTTVGDVAVPVRALGNMVGELILLEGLIDPDTGDHGRVGKIAGAAGLAAGTVTIDNTRSGFEALLARMAVVQG